MELENAVTRIKTLKETLSNLEAEINNYRSREFTFDKIKEDPAAVKVYTGFPYALYLESVFEYLGKNLSTCSTGPKH